MKPDRSPRRLALSKDQREELVRRSEAHRKNPGEAVPLDKVLADLEAGLDPRAAPNP